MQRFPEDALIDEAEPLRRPPGGEVAAVAFPLIAPIAELEGVRHHHMHGLGRDRPGFHLDDHRRRLRLGQAGLEHLGRGTARHVDGLIAVVAPHASSVRTVSVRNTTVALTRYTTVAVVISPNCSLSRCVGKAR